jgi:hypothetical protein
MGKDCANASLSGRGDTGVPHMAGCACSNVESAKLLKLKRIFCIDVSY